MRPAPWALVQYRLPDSTEIRSGALVDEVVVTLPEPCGGRPLMSLLAEWETVGPALRGWSPGAGRPVPGARITAPLTYPGKVLCAGANYHSHVAEMGGAAADPAAEPFFFLKPPTTTVIGPGDPVPYPSAASTLLDWEVELGVVLGHRVRDLEPEEVHRHIAGYVGANDLSARDRIARPDAVSPHFVYDWLAQKGQDGFCPLGPGIVPAWLIGDPQRLQLRLSVNGVLKQDTSTSDMIVPIDRLVAAASRLGTLEPGDVILTGTPAGVGMPRSEYLSPGDTVRIEIEGIGAFENRVVARNRSALTVARS